jgi:hypothetical protein
MFRKNLFLFAFLSVISFSFAQNPLKINNKITPQHERVEGSKIYFIPPTGFSPRQEIMGYVQEGTNNSILVKEASGSYKSLTQTFMTENMNVKGIKLISQEKFMLNDDEATLFKVTQKVSKFTFGKFMLFSGDDDFCILVSAVFPQDNAKLEAEIKKSLMTIAFKEIDESLPQPRAFNLKFADSNLKFARKIVDAVIYSGDGKTSVNALEKNSFFAGSGVAKTQDYLAFSADRLQKQIKTNLKIESNNPIKIAGLEGSEIIASTTTSDGKARLLYQVLLFNDGNYYIMYGSAIEDSAKQLAVFQQLAKSFELGK